jgi:uncharacterized protein YjbI with pentapeptide repeats
MNNITGIGKHLARNANLAGSEFSKVNLRGAVFNDVNLAASVFKNKNISDAKQTDLNLSRVAIADCILDGMTTEGIDVSEAILIYRESK